MSTMKVTECKKITGNQIGIIFEEFICILVQKISIGPIIKLILILCSVILVDSGRGQTFPVGLQQVFTVAAIVVHSSIRISIMSPL